MGKWHQEEVAGDRYIYDSANNPIILGCPQNAPVFVVPGEHEVEAERACAAHNAEFESWLDDNDIYRELHNRLAADNGKLRERVKELENEHSAKLAAVLRIIRDETEARCYCEFNRDGVRTLQCEHCETYEHAKTVAEGE